MKISEIISEDYSLKPTTQHDVNTQMNPVNKYSRMYRLLKGSTKNVDGHKQDFEKDKNRKPDTGKDTWVPAKDKVATNKSINRHNKKEVKETASAGSTSASAVASNSGAGFASGPGTVKRMEENSDTDYGHNYKAANNCDYGKTLISYGWGKTSKMREHVLDCLKCSKVNSHVVPEKVKESTDPWKSAMSNKPMTNKDFYQFSKANNSSNSDKKLGIYVQGESEPVKTLGEYTNKAAWNANFKLLTQYSKEHPDEVCYMKQVDGNSGSSNKLKAGKRA